MKEKRIFEKTLDKNHQILFKKKIATQDIQNKYKENLIQAHPSHTARKSKL